MVQLMATMTKDVRTVLPAASVPLLLTHLIMCADGEKEQGASSEEGTPTSDDLVMSSVGAGDVDNAPVTEWTLVTHASLPLMLRALNRRRLLVAVACSWSTR